MDKKDVILALGSNFQQETNTDLAISLIAKSVFINHITQRLWTDPIGMQNANFLPRQRTAQFLNCLIKGQTALNKDELTIELKRIESLCDRSKEGSHKGIIPMDIDILQYEGIHFHSEDRERDYIKTLFLELSD